MLTFGGALLEARACQWDDEVEESVFAARMRLRLESFPPEVLPLIAIKAAHQTLTEAAEPSRWSQLFLGRNIGEMDTFQQALMGNRLTLNTEAGRCAYALSHITSLTLHGLAHESGLTGVYDKRLAVDESLGEASQDVENLTAAGVLAEPVIEEFNNVVSALFLKVKNRSVLHLLVYPHHW